LISISHHLRHASLEEKFVTSARKRLKLYLKHGRGLRRFYVKCQHSGIELWMQLQDFWDGLTSASHRTLSNVIGGPLMKKTPEEIVTILDELSKDAN